MHSRVMVGVLWRKILRKKPEDSRVANIHDNRFGNHLGWRRFCQFSYSILGSGPICFCEDVKSGLTQVLSDGMDSYLTGMDASPVSNS
jgi:hypothetical protein